MLNIAQFHLPNYKRAGAYWRDLVKEGKGFGIPDRENSKEPDHARHVRSLFAGHEYLVRELEDVEDVISFLNDEVAHDEHSFRVPLDNDVEYLLQVNNHILVYLYGTDDYLGHGESELYFQLRGAAVLDEANVSDGEWTELAGWLQKAFPF